MLLILYRPLPEGGVPEREDAVAVAPLDDVGQRPRREAVDGAHDLEAGARLVVLVQQLPPEPVHHRQHRRYSKDAGIDIQRSAKVDAPGRVNAVGKLGRSEKLQQ